MYKCDEGCSLNIDTDEGYYFFNLKIDGLDLDPGRLEWQPNIPSIEDPGLNPDDEYLDRMANTTMFNATRYYFLVCYFLIM